MPMNLYEKIQAVSNDIKNIEKNLTVGRGANAYKAVADSDVITKVKEFETKHRILSIPMSQELLNSESLKKVNDKGAESYVLIDNIKMVTRIIDLDDINQFIDITSLAKGVDSSDKGFGKASTYARKYALLNIYKIATGEDLDSNKSEDITTVTLDKKKIDVLNILSNDENLRTNIINHFGCVSTDDFTNEQIDIIYNNFKKKGLL